MLYATQLDIRMYGGLVVENFNDFVTHVLTHEECNCNLDLFNKQKIGTS